MEFAFNNPFVAYGLDNRTGWLFSFCGPVNFNWGRKVKSEGVLSISGGGCLIW